MLKTWDKSKIDVYFEDEEQETFIRQGFNNLVRDIGAEEVETFVNALNALHELPVAHAVVQESYLYLT